MEEFGDRVPGERRVVPISATLTFDLSATPPSLNTVITNAVLEGGDPFSLLVRSSSATQHTDGTYDFEGDYLRELYPSGTQYLFSWRFSTSAAGEVVWNGATYWAGGHIWQISISNLTVVLQPQLSISRAGNSSAQIAWATNFTGYLLESTALLPAVDWSIVTNSVTTNGDRLSITVDTEPSPRFYRLRKP